MFSGFIKNYFKYIVILSLVFSMIACGGLDETETATPEPSGSNILQPTEEVENSEVAEGSEEAETPDVSEADSSESVPVGDGSKPQWTVMFYMDADDETLEKDIFTDLNEAETVGSSDQVNIVALLDRYKGGFNGDGNWNSARRFYLTQDDDLSTIASEYDDMGELDMSQTKTLIDFVTWAVENYPAEKYMLVMSDHGAGWTGGFWDPAPSGDDNSHMALNTIEGALAEIQNNTGIEKFELIGFDACLMSQLEVYTALVPYANYAIASQETEPSVGWAYSGFLSKMVEDPAMDGKKVAREIVNDYIVQDIRVTDEKARTELAEDIYGQRAKVSADKIAADLGEDITLSAIDLSAIPAVNENLNEMALSMSKLNKQSWVTKARTHARAFTSIFGDDVPKSFIDLSSFAKLLKKNVDNSAFSSVADKLVKSVDDAVMYEKHGPKRNGASGIALYFPNSNLFEEDYGGALAYTESAVTFASESLWDDFLAFHYFDEPMPAQNTQKAAVPEAGTKIKSPGTEPIKIDEITISSDVVTQDKPVTLNTNVTGNQIGFIYTFVGYYDQEQNGLIVSDMDFLAADDTKEMDGVYYPDWGEGQDIPIDYDWSPIVYAVSDGKTVVPALFSPEDYGAQDEEATYSLEGIYTFAESQETRYANIYFSGGEMTGVVGFMGEDGRGAPSEITPQEGDTFTILNTLISNDITSVEGETLTFSGEPFTWEEIPAKAGQYVLGFIAEDLNGNSYEEYVPVEVKE